MVERPAPTREVAGSNPVSNDLVRSLPTNNAGSRTDVRLEFIGLLFAIIFIFDGSQDWVIPHNDVVAGSSPASGTKCRSSSTVEHVIPSSFLIRRYPNPDFGPAQH